MLIVKYWNEKLIRVTPCTFLYLIQTKHDLPNPETSVVVEYYCCQSSALQCLQGWDAKNILLVWIESCPLFSVGRSSPVISQEVTQQTVLILTKQSWERLQLSVSDGGSEPPDILMTNLLHQLSQHRSDHSPGHPWHQLLIWNIQSLPHYTYDIGNPSRNNVCNLISNTCMRLKRLLRGRRLSLPIPYLIKCRPYCGIVLIWLWDSLD